MGEACYLKYAIQPKLGVIFFFNFLFLWISSTSWGKDITTDSSSTKNWRENKSYSWRAPKIKVRQMSEKKLHGCFFKQEHGQKRDIRKCRFIKIEMLTKLSVLQKCVWEKEHKKPASLWLCQVRTPLELTASVFPLKTTSHFTYICIFYILILYLIATQAQLS